MLTAPSLVAGRLCPPEAHQANQVNFTSVHRIACIKAAGVLQRACLFATRFFCRSPNRFPQSRCCIAESATIRNLFFCRSPNRFSQSHCCIAESASIRNLVLLSFTESPASKPLLYCRERVYSQLGSFAVHRIACIKAAGVLQRTRLFATRFFCRSPNRFPQSRCCIAESASLRNSVHLKILPNSY